jgi:hypothetical protein
MNLDELKRLMVIVSGDGGKNVSLSPEQFVDQLHLAQLKHYKRKIGLPEEYQPGMPLPRQAFELTEKITEDLRIFKVVKGWGVSEPLSVNSIGVANYPDNYYIVSSMTYDLGVSSSSRSSVPPPPEGVSVEHFERPNDVLSDLEYQNRRTSVVEKPDKWFPVCNMQADKIFFSGISNVKVNMVYLRALLKPYYATTSEKGYLQYDHDHSRQMEWDDINLIDIMSIMLGDIGISTSNANLYQYAEKLKERGI